MGELPNEIWLEIFKRLNGATLFEEVPLVCKRFNALAKATTPLFAIKNDNGVLKDLFNTKEVQAAIEDENLYIKGFATAGIEAIDDMVKVRNLVKNQPGLKRLLLSSKLIARSKEEATLADKAVKEVILDLKYLEWLDLEGLEITTKSHENWVITSESYTSKGQNFSLMPWNKEDLRRLLVSNKSLKHLLLPSITTNAFNFLLEDPEAKEWRGSAKKFVTSGLHRNMFMPEPKISWKNLGSLRELVMLRAGELDADFWTALSALPNLHMLELNLTMAGLEEIVSVKKGSGGSKNSSVRVLSLFCNDCIDWKRAPRHVLQKLLAFFPLVAQLDVECRIENALDVGFLFNLFSHWLLNALSVKVYHVRDRSIDWELIQKLEKPIRVLNLKELTFSSFVTELSDIAITENETLFQPVLTRLFQGTNVELVEFANFRHLGGVLQTWGNKELRDTEYHSRLAFPRWCKRGTLESIEYLAENTGIIRQVFNSFLLISFLAWLLFEVVPELTLKAIGNNY